MLWKGEETVHDGDEDLQLVDLARSGDVQAFEQLYRRHRAAFREFVRHNAPDMNPSELAGEEFIRAWKLMQQLELELLTAMAQEPENPLLRQRLMQLRAHQLKLLHVIADSRSLSGLT
jgi:hypothetical protein